jgi:hypothetical protein
MRAMVSRRRAVRKGGTGNYLTCGVFIRAVP